MHIIHNGMSMQWQVKAIVYSMSSDILRLEILNKCTRSVCLYWLLVCQIFGWYCSQSLWTEQLQRQPPVMTQLVPSISNSSVVQVILDALNSTIAFNGGHPIIWNNMMDSIHTITSKIDWHQVQYLCLCSRIRLYHECLHSWIHLLSVHWKLHNQPRLTSRQWMALNILAQDC